MLCNRGLTTSVNAASRTAAASHLRTKLQAASVHRMLGGGGCFFRERVSVRQLQTHGPRLCGVGNIIGSFHWS